MELGNLAEEREAEDKDDSSEGNRHSGGEEDEGESSKGANGNKRNVARTFRYMRKRPTIIFYKPPEGESTKKRGWENTWVEFRNETIPLLQRTLKRRRTRRRKAEKRPETAPPSGPRVTSTLW